MTPEHADDEALRYEDSSAAAPNVQVIVRVRPLNSYEISLRGHDKCVRQESCQTLTWTGRPESRMTFDLVADESFSQEDLFQVAGIPMVENCVGGYNSCMLAYGQIGSGKTHTMLGDIDGGPQRDNVNCGMTPRVFEYLFSRIQKERESRKDEKLEFTCKCSFLEIYNEQILDLLDPSDNNLQIREDHKKGVYVESLKEVEVSSTRDVFQQLIQVAANRKVAATDMNLASSRSHSVFTCVIESKWESQGVTHHRCAQLNLVDLAGSERQKSSGAENKSLSTLRLVIMNLGSVSNGKSLEIPYRDSKLTFLLQDSLGGNAKTIIIANISPSSCSSLETLSTLEFAQRAKFIKNNVKFTVEDMQRIMSNEENIRHVSVIANRHLGKSTLTSLIVAAAGINAPEPADAAESGIKIEAEFGMIPLYYPNDGKDHLINLIDSPGNSAALRNTDGALVVVDCIEDVVCGQTETMFRVALGERIRPVLILNKVDRCFLDVKLNGEQAYAAMKKVIDDANAIIVGNVPFSPEKGNVVFSSGRYGWAFTLSTFARESSMMEKLWGDNFFDPFTDKWTTEKTCSKTCMRGFVHFCYNPIEQIYKFIMEGDQYNKIWDKLTELGVTMTAEEKKLTRRPLMKRVMPNWLPASKALLETIIFHLPSAAEAQAYRVKSLYGGPLDDQYATAIRNCDPEGPLMLYLFKIVRASDKGKFLAVGRVFSGEVGTGSTVRVMGPNYVPGTKKDLYVSAVRKTAVLMGNQFWETEEYVPCGNIVVIMLRLDQLITNATLTDDTHPFRRARKDAHPFRRVRKDEDLLLNCFML